MQRRIHTFDNGVMVYDDHLISIQRERYKQRNVHEAEEEDIFTEIIHSIPGNGCFVDVGAAIGYYPLLAKKIAPDLTIYGIEPLKRHHKFFLENIALNGFIERDFVIITKGISQRGGYMRFSDKGYGSSLHENKDGVAHAGFVGDLFEKVLRKMRFREHSMRSSDSISIKTMTLDKLMHAVRTPVDLLQMDVQGFEASVLKGGISSLQTNNIRTLLIGTHGLPVHRECLSILQECNYEIEFDQAESKNQPDGIIVASKGVRRIKSRDNKA